MSSPKGLTAEAKAERGMFMSLSELADLLGFPRHKMYEIARKPEFPLFEGKVRHQEFLSWYKKQLARAREAANEGPVEIIPLRSNARRQVPP